MHFNGEEAPQFNSAQFNSALASREMSWAFPKIVKRLLAVKEKEALLVDQTVFA